MIPLPKKRMKNNSTPIMEVNTFLTIKFTSRILMNRRYYFPISYMKV
jgi:hypothetical protein